MTASNRSLEYWAPKLRAALGRETNNIIEIGKILRNCREAAKHGTFLSWLANNFDLSERSAYNYIKASEYVERQGELATVANLAPGVLYQLADEEFEPALEQAILKASTVGRVDMGVVEMLARNMQDAENLAQEAAEAQAEDAEAQAEDAELEEILDGPPPEVPQPEEPKPIDFNLQAFDKAIDTLKRLRTKPIAGFATSTEHTAEDLEHIEQFIRDVRLMRERPM